ncbi:MAG: hypothetical protein Barrevirus11_1, partial [Barrevirus sp.]
VNLCDKTVVNLCDKPSVNPSDQIKDIDLVETGWKELANLVTEANQKIKDLNEENENLKKGQLVEITTASFHKSSYRQEMLNYIKHNQLVEKITEKMIKTLNH